MITYTVRPGTDIFDACERACEYAANLGDSLCLNFNGTDVVVKPGDKASQVLGQWGRNREHGINANVGWEHLL